MLVEKTTYKALNIELILEKIKPVSSLGLQRKKECRPFTKGAEKEANSAYQHASFLLDKLQKEPHAATSIKEILPHIHAIHFILKKVQSKTTLELFELQEIKQFLYFSIKLSHLCKTLNWNLFQNEKEMVDLFAILDPGKQNTPAFFLHDSYSDEFAKTKQETERLQSKIDVEFNLLKKKAAAILERENLPVEIVVSRFQQELADKLFQNDYFYLKSENFANYCFALRKNDSIVIMEQTINKLQEKLMILEEHIRNALTKKMSANLTILQLSQNEVAEFDWLLAKAEFALNFNCVVPEICPEKEIVLQKARNLPIEWELHKNNVSYQPISLVLDKRLNVLTGANMAGKTTLLKMIGQLQYLAAFAIPLPCEKARLPLLDFIFYSGYYEERMDLSNFGTEIFMLQEKWRNQGLGFFLIDEFARGTNPYEGEAISKAVLDEFSQKECLTLFSTHFQAPVTVQNAVHYQIIGFTKECIAALKKDLNKEEKALTDRLKYLHQFMNYEVVKVDSQTEPPQAALLIAELLGIDERIIKKAYRYLQKHTFIEKS